MNVFDLDRSLIGDYERFARSFTQIRATDIQEQVEAIYASDRFWPEPLITINPHFERGASVTELVNNGSLQRRRTCFVWTVSRSRSTATRPRPWQRPRLARASSLRPAPARASRFASSYPSTMRPFVHAYARAYDLTRDKLRYILDPTDVMGPTYPSETFRVLKSNELRRHGEYRTARLEVAAWDRTEAAGELKAMGM